MPKVNGSRTLYKAGRDHVLGVSFEPLDDETGRPSYSSTVRGSAAVASVHAVLTPLQTLSNEAAISNLVALRHMWASMINSTTWMMMDSGIPKAAMG
jgi:hypothetical protein